MFNQMGLHEKKHVEALLAELQERYEKLLTVVRGRETTMMTQLGERPALSINEDAVHIAADDLSTALRRIKSRLGKS